LARFPQGDPDVVVRDVLGQPQFREAVPTTATPPQPTILQLIWQWVYDHAIAPLFAKLGSALGASPALASAIGIGAILVALVALVVVVQRVLARRVRADNAGADVHVLLPTERDAASWVAFARAAAANGDFATAIAALFAAALVTLDARAIVAFDAARTPGEYRRLVRLERPPAADAFDALASLFVRARYARETPDAGAYGEAADAYARFVPPASAA